MQEAAKFAHGVKRGFWDYIWQRFALFSGALAGLLLSFLGLGTLLGCWGRRLYSFLPGHSYLVIPACSFLPLVIPASLIPAWSFLPYHSYFWSFLPGHSCSYSFLPLITPSWSFLPGHSYLWPFLPLLIPAPAHSFLWSLVPVVIHSHLCSLLLFASDCRSAHAEGFGSRVFPLAMDPQEHSPLTAGAVPWQKYPVPPQACQCSCCSATFGDTVSHPRSAFAVFSLKQISLIV